MGNWIGARLPRNAVVGLDGALGAGKTCMAQGLARGWGLPEHSPVVSPAYNLMMEYRDGPRLLAHIDFYRLDSLAPGDGLMILDILEQPDSTVLVEWAEKFLADLVDAYLSVRIERPHLSDERVITIQTVGSPTIYGDLISETEAYARTLN